jgi:NitT/TauT family transport system substrate-binding protein
MNHPELATTGLGAVDPDRFKQAIDLVVKADGLPRTPDASEIFTNAFLPSQDERIFKLL